MNHPIVTLTIANRGAVKIELYPEYASNTVNSFISLIQKGFYDGLMFHRIIQGFMVQGGDPSGTGTGGPGYHIPGEFKSNGHPNPLKHEEGVLSMARSAHPDSAGSQFFIMTSKSPHLDGQYAAFGKVLEGYDIVDAMEKVQTNQQDRPIESEVIQSATVELNGYAYAEPITL